MGYQRETAPAPTPRRGEVTGTTEAGSPGSKRSARTSTHLSPETTPGLCVAYIDIAVVTSYLVAQSAVLVLDSNDKRFLTQPYLPRERDVQSAMRRSGTFLSRV